MTFRSVLSFLLKIVLNVLHLIAHVLKYAVLATLFGLITAVTLESARRSYGGGIPGYTTTLLLLGSFIGLFLTTGAISIVLRPHFRKTLNQWLEKDGWLWTISGFALYLDLLLVGYIAGQSLPATCTSGWSFACFGQWLYLLGTGLVALIVIAFWAFALLVGQELERADAIERELYKY